MHRHDMVRALVVTLTLAWATASHATPLFLASLDACDIDTSSDLVYWDAIQGSVNAAATTVDGTSGNQCSLEISAPSGGAEYVAQTISSASTVVASMRFRVPTSATPPTVRRKVLSFYDTGASKTGCMVTIEQDDADSSKFRLMALYESADNTGGECSASATQDGKECTAASDCDYVNSGEQSCAPGAYASTLALDKGTWYLVTLKQVNGTGEVTCSLWQGTAGTSPASYQRGSQTRDQGVCTGGSVAGNACDDSGDCTGGGSCTTTDVVTIEQVRFGTDDTETGAITYFLDDLVIDSADANPNYWIQTVLPSGAGTESDWTGSYTDIDDGPALDGNTTKLSKANETSCTSGNCYHDVATTNPATDTILAVGLSGWAQDTETGVGRTMNLQLDAHDGTNTASGVAVDMDSYSDQGSSAEYHQLPPAIFATAPDGSAWSATDANNLQIRVNRNSSTHTTNEVRVTAAQAEVLFDLADPAVPTIIPDRNQDGEDTVCLVGDSTYNDSGFHDLVVGGLIEPTNVLDCARGGATAGDIADGLSVAGNNNDILDGGTTQFVSCRALKGAATKTCDVAVLQIGVNTLHTGVTADPANDSAENGLRMPGYCDSKGGANDGGACVCPAGTGSRLSDYDGTAARYCRTKGSDWLTECRVGADCACSASAECCADCPDGTCATCSTSAGVCSGSVCTCTGLGCLDCGADATAANWSSSCVPGCLDSPQCPSGLCIAHESVGDAMQEIRAIASARAARPTPAATPPVGGAPLIVYAAPPPGQIKNLLGCWQDAERSIDNYGASLRTWARDTSAPWLDMYARFRADCPNGVVSGRACQTSGCTWDATTCPYDRGCCLRDEIHWNALGQAVAADAIIACLTNDGGTTDGVCTGSVCTGGKVNDPCSTNADCATWQCALTGP